MESTQIKPALTKEEWARITPDTGIIQRQINGVTYGYYAGTTPEGRHAMAALALYGQPFGFTRKDVQNLRAGGEWVRMDGLTADEFRKSLADRIEALLPLEAA